MLLELRMTEDSLTLIYQVQANQSPINPHLTDGKGHISLDFISFKSSIGPPPRFWISNQQQQQQLFRLKIKIKELGLFFCAAVVVVAAEACSYIFTT